MSQNLYLERYAWKEPIFPNHQPREDLGIIIVLPAFKETDLLSALDSINACTKPRESILILVVINESESAKEEESTINQQCLDALRSYNSKYEMLISHQKLPSKKAGVGLARKIGMDEAVRFFDKNGKDGIIACYDADCMCQENYLVEIERQFSDFRVKAGIVFYEHRIDGENQSEIIHYETYLRYYIDALRFAGHPFAHQTLGSCILVRSSRYQAQGGMNSRKAGEDFYFLNKIIPQGGFVEINSTTVYPSDRISDRVPFGTGKAIGALLHSTESATVYNSKSFEDLKKFFSCIHDFWEHNQVELPESVNHFLKMEAASEILEIRQQTSTFQSFYKRFFLWFDAFKVLKFIHFARDHYYHNISLSEAVTWLEKIFPGITSGDSKTQLLRLRAIDREGPKPNQINPSHQ